MALTFEIRLTGQSEKLVSDLVASGLRPEEVIAKGLWLLQQVRETGRVAVLRPGVVERGASETLVETLLRLDVGAVESNLSPATPAPAEGAVAVAPYAVVGTEPVSIARDYDVAVVAGYDAAAAAVEVAAAEAAAAEGETEVVDVADAPGEPDAKAAG